MHQTKLVYLLPIAKWIDSEQRKNCPQCRAACTIQEIRRIFLSENPKENWIPDLLQIAAKSGHFEIYKRLSSEEEDKNPKGAFILLC